MTFAIKCSYPTHAQHSDQPGWTDGTLATADTPLSGFICSGCSAFDAANPPVVLVNQQSLQQKAQAALAANLTVLAQPAPNFPLPVAAQQALVAQVAALTRQVDALIMFALNKFDSTTGT